jgi:SAM-dependent methyltransferase
VSEPAGELSAPAARCEWCGVAFNGGVARLRGRARCERCGAATTDPVPSDAELHRAYALWYRPRDGRFVGPGDALLRRSRGQLARRLDGIAPPGPILDVGAGDGTLLDALKERGRTAVGLERAASRSDMREAEIQEVEGQWAAIVMWHALEHLRHAGAALDRAAEILAPGGVLVVAMPNADSLQARAFGDRWFALDVPRHLVHVPAAALLERLHNLRLSVERVSHVRGGQAVFGWLHGLVGSLPGHPELYDAIRRPEARRGDPSPARRGVTLTAAAMLVPLAAACAAGEAALRRGGSIYVEARRA